MIMIPLFLAPLPYFNCLLLYFVINLRRVAAGVIYENINSSVCFQYGVNHRLHLAESVKSLEERRRFRLVL